MNTFKLRLKQFLWSTYLVIQPWVRIAMLMVATIWRRLMFRTTFIVITGSVGKTTAKEAIFTALSPHFPTHRSRGSQNHYDGLFKTLLRVRPWHRYAVVEIGLDRPGQMRWLAWAARPDIAVWISIARTHTRSFLTLENTAKEKSQLVQSLRPGGLAILNVDNPYIAEFVPPSHIRTITYGQSAASDWRVSEAASIWPQRLSFRVQNQGELVKVETQLVGKHWVPSVTPALIVAKEVGLSISQAAAALQSLQPFEQRLSLSTCPNGATFLRDERNGSVDTLQAAFEVMREAKASRRIIVFSDVSDSKQTLRKRHRDIGMQAAQCAEAAVFIGDSHSHAVRGAVEAGMSPDQVWGFYNLEDAARHLRSEVRNGDLVLLRGLHVEHLSRLYLTILREVSCWRTSCLKKIFCDDCPQLSAPQKSEIHSIRPAM